MKKILCALLFLIATSISVNAADLHFKDGRVIKVGSYWEADGMFHCSMYGGKMSFPADQIDVEKMREQTRLEEEKLKEQARIEEENMNEQARIEEEKAKIATEKMALEEKKREEKKAAIEEKKHEGKKAAIEIYRREKEEEAARIAAEKEESQRIAEKKATLEKKRLEEERAVLAKAGFKGIYIKQHTFTLPKTLKSKTSGYGYEGLHNGDWFNIAIVTSVHHFDVIYSGTSSDGDEISKKFTLAQALWVHSMTRSPEFALAFGKDENDKAWGIIDTDNRIAYYANPPASPTATVAKVSYLPKDSPLLRIKEGDFLTNNQASDLKKSAVIADKTDITVAIIKPARKIKSSAPPPPKTSSRTEYSSGTWYEGGTLHRATVAEWNSASYSNKLATAADMALSASSSIQAQVKRSGSMDALRPYATQLVSCLDQAASGQGYGRGSVASLAASCIMLSGW